MIISHSHRFIFFHVAKTGGMSIRKALQDYCQEPDRFRINRPSKVKAGQPNPFYEVWEALLLHATMRDAQKELPGEIFNSYYKFAFVRNPWDWQVSMYHFILRDPTHVKHEQVKQLGSFAAYLTWVIATDNPYPKGATKLQSRVLTDAKGKLLADFVGRYETLEQDFAKICDRLGIAVELPHVNGSVHRDYRDYYDANTRQLVAEHFRADIELFQYTFI
jgi:hypothetical protein